MEKEKLVATLKEAGEAHHEYEQVILGGVRDEKWADWYAAFLVGRFSNCTPSVVTKALQQAAEQHQQHSEIPWNEFYADAIVEIVK